MELTDYMINSYKNPHNKFIFSIFTKNENVMGELYIIAFSIPLLCETGMT